MGRYFGKLCEYDLMFAYMESLMDHLDDDGLNYVKQTTDDLIYPNSLVLHFKFGWQKDDKKCASACVSYANIASREIGMAIYEGVSDWGKCYATHSHSTKRQESDKRAFLKKKDTLGVSVEPFKLNCAENEAYAARANEFGKIMAHVVFEFLKGRGELPKIAKVAYG